MQIILYNMSIAIQQEPPNTMTSLQSPNMTLDKMSKNAWKEVPKDTTPFLDLPQEIQLKVFEYLNPIDSTCLSLVK